jgi:retron-type reverse transcriptase
MALEKIRKDLLDGYVYVIDADLQSYFDTIPHEKLMEKVGEEISDGSVLNLIELTLKSGVMDNGSFYLNDRGSPQGGVCSPLLSNIYLHAFDAVMVERGHRIARFADDCAPRMRGA